MQPRLDALLSWNMGCGPYAKAEPDAIRRRLALLRQIVSTRSVALLTLQEAPSEAELKATLGVDFDLARTVGGAAIACRMDRWIVDHSDVSEARIACLGLRGVGVGTNLWVWSYHGPAMHKSERQKRAFLRTNLVKHVGARRAADDLRLNVVAGDFNLSPFDDAIVGDDAMNANRSIRWVASRSTGLGRAMFNPTWTLLGRCHDAPGTFYQSSVDLDGPWYGYDQVLVSPELAQQPGFTIDVVDRVLQQNLRCVGPVGRPDVTVGSDHLPIVAVLVVP